MTPEIGRSSNGAGPGIGRWTTWGDVALAFCLAAISVLVAHQAAAAGVAGADSPETWWQWLIVVVPSLAIVFRTKAPLAATQVAVIAQMLIWGLNLAEVFVAPLVMIYTVGALGTQTGRRVGIASSVALTTMTGVGIVTAPDVGIDLFLLTGLSSTVALLLGVSVANQRAAASRLAADLAVERLEQAIVRERAVVMERERIAHEMHDLVGHSLSVIAVRSEAAQRVGAKRPDALVDAVGAIGDTARKSLAEVRRVLHAELEPGEAALAPGPTLCDIEGLVDEVSSAGIPITFDHTGPLDSPEVDAATAAGVYRIVQEALTNTIKHAGPGAHVEVELVVTPADVVVTVTDDGSGPSGEQSGTGIGLTGMAERARFLGGSFDAGRAPGGGFRVRAEIPNQGGTRTGTNGTGAGANRTASTVTDEGVGTA